MEVSPDNQIRIQVLTDRFDLRMKSAYKQYNQPFNTHSKTIQIITTAKFRKNPALQPTQRGERYWTQLKQFHNIPNNSEHVKLPHFFKCLNLINEDNKDLNKSVKPEENVSQQSRKDEFEI